MHSLKLSSPLLRLSFFVISIIYTEDVIATKLSSDCDATLRLSLDELGLGLGDMQDPQKRNLFRNTYKGSQIWLNIIEACYGKETNLKSFQCEDCDPLDQGNCTPFVSWCWYHCDCK